MKWTKEEEEFLCNNYEMKDAKYYSEALNRSIQSIRAKASKLGIKRKNNTHAFKGSVIHDIEIQGRSLSRIGEYVGANVPIDYQCHNCMNIWRTSPSHIIGGRNCPYCRGHGFKDTESACLYLVELDIGEEDALYKLGITNNNPRKRLAEDFNKFKATICWIKYFDIGKDARELETKLKREYSDFQYNTGLLKSGNTETFSCYINEPEIK